MQRKPSGLTLQGPASTRYRVHGYRQMPARRSTRYCVHRYRETCRRKEVDTLLRASLPRDLSRKRGGERRTGTQRRAGDKVSAITFVNEVPFLLKSDVAAYILGSRPALPFELIAVDPHAAGVVP
jgi:hypothetical protein